MRIEKEPKQVQLLNFDKEIWKSLGYDKVQDDAYTQYFYKLGKVKWKFSDILKKSRKDKVLKRFVRRYLNLIWRKFLEKEFRKNTIFLSLRFTYRNCWVTLAHKTGDVIVAYSCGRALLCRGRYGERKLVGRSRRLSLPVLVEMAYLSLRKLKMLGFKRVYVILRCFPTFMVEVFLRILVSGGIHICGIFLRVPIAHNGCKIFNSRRV